MTHTPNNTDPFRNHRGLLGPAWCFELARSITPDDVPPNFAAASPVLREAVDYLTRCAQGHFIEASQRYPRIAAAEALQANIEQVERLKLMVLADLPRDEIAQRLAFDEPVIEAWESLFFDLRDLRQAHQWLAMHVVEKERQHGNQVQASQMTLAIMAGPVAVRALLDSGSPQPIDEAVRLFQRHLQLQLKLDQAVNLPLQTERANVRFIRVYIQLQQAQQRLDLARTKLELRCTEMRARHERQQERRELAQRRATAQDSVRKQRQQARRWPVDQPSTDDDIQLAKYRALAEAQALSERIAQSPLSAVTWETSPLPPNDVADLAGSLVNKTEDVLFTTGGLPETAAIAGPIDTADTADTADTDTAETALDCAGGAIETDQVNSGHESALAESLPCCSHPQELMACENCSPSPGQQLPGDIAELPLLTTNTWRLAEEYHPRALALTA
jgi:hypothetical protein